MGPRKDSGAQRPLMYISDGTESTTSTRSMRPMTRGKLNSTTCTRSGGQRASFTAKACITLGKCAAETGSLRSSQCRRNCPATQLKSASSRLSIRACACASIARFCVLNLSMDSSMGRLSASKRRLCGSVSLAKPFATFAKSISFRSCTRVSNCSASTSKSATLRKRNFEYAFASMAQLRPSREPLAASLWAQAAMASSAASCLRDARA
mmetsp:Transcript_91212/g.195645  ORF Transcript_91212/g.195645 Transcript_91212/m.195645 type:complete len:209 (+) Transcript_91212:388-1014(+)